MSDGQKLKDAVIEYNKRQKEINERLNQAEVKVEQRRQAAKE